VITEFQIRDRLAAIIRAAAPTALVSERWIQAVEDEQWGALLRSPADASRIHCWMVELEGIPEIGRIANRREYRLRFVIQGFRFYESGTAQANSSRAWNEECMAVARAVNADVRLGVSDNSLREVSTLVFTKLGVTQFGMQLAHAARGAVTVTTLEF
jgi:hypothetical protein